MDKKKSVPKWLIKPPSTFIGLLRLTAHGDAEPQEIPVVYRHMSKTEANDWWQKAKVSEEPAAKILLDIIEGFVDEDGSVVPATQENFQELMELWPKPFVDAVGSWFDHLNTGRLKN